MHKLQAGMLAAGLLFSSVIPMAAQQDRRDSRGNYYNGMHQQVRKGDYERYNRRDEQQHHHDSGGGIGPGKATLIGGAGGAALGAIFGGGLKGTIIGGAAGAGIGAIGGKLAQGNDDKNRRDDHHR
jgi:hypothetical protein